jgi:carbon storage regulator
VLVLSRKSRESIMIGNDIEIIVLSVRDEHVRLGIRAPRRVSVFRKELYLEIAQKRAAAGEPTSAEVNSALKRLSDAS